MEDLKKAGDEIKEALITIGGVIAATKAVFEAITMPIRGLLLLYDTISDFFGDADKKNKNKQREVLERRLAMVDPNSPQAQRIKAQLDKMDKKEGRVPPTAGQDFSDVPEDFGMSTGEEFAYLGSLRVGLRKEREALLEEEEKLKDNIRDREKQLESQRQMIADRIAKEERTHTYVDDPERDRLEKEFRTKMLALIKSDQKTLEVLQKSNKERFQVIAEEIDLLDRAADPQRAALKRKRAFADMTPAQKVDEMTRMVNEAASRSDRRRAMPVQINNVSPTTVDASSSSVTSAPSTPISPSPNYVAIL